MAAVSMAKRLTYERKGVLGQEVGYQIRFNQCYSADTSIKFVTDGVLMNQLLKDRLIQQADIVVVDEAHERTVDTEIIVSLIKRAVNTRSNLKMVVMSATLNYQLFKEYLDDAGVFQIQGRSYPVDIKYTDKIVGYRKVISESVTAAIRMHLHEEEGDILVFLAGSEDCEKAVKQTMKRLEELCQEREVPGMVIFSLYSQLPFEQQQQIFKKAPEGCRKIIYSTNISETSLTIQKIKYVIDSGYFKQKEYNSVTGIDSLRVQTISKSMAKQRAGRAGRESNGKCYRLYTFDQFVQMKDQQIPEILRVNLESQVLRLKFMGEQDVLNFDFIEKPDRQQIVSAVKSLYLLGCIDNENQITELGKQVVGFPLEPKYAKIIVLSKYMGIQEQMIQLVSILSCENVWQKDRNIDKQKFRDKQSKVVVDTGDHETYQRIWRKWVRNDRSQKYAHSNCFNVRSLNMADNIQQQLELVARNVDYKVLKPFVENESVYQVYEKQKLSESEKIRLCLCGGLFRNVVKRMNNGDKYMLLNDGSMVDIDIGSAVCLKQNMQDYFLFSELVQNDCNVPIVKQLSVIKYGWIEQYFKDMVQAEDEDFIRTMQNLKRKIDPDKEKSIQKLERMAIQMEKVEEAKQRFLERKRFHHN